ncbi:Uncharacterized protein APZ42_005199, partial [Daphnia magna]
ICHWPCRAGAKSWPSSMLLPTWTACKKQNKLPTKLACKQPKPFLSNAKRQPNPWPRRSAAPCSNWACKAAALRCSCKLWTRPHSMVSKKSAFLVAGHEGSTPRPVGKVASGGELSRIALAIAVTTSELGEAGTLIFDEVDSGVG